MSQQQPPQAETGQPLRPSANGAAAQDMEGGESDSSNGGSESESEPRTTVAPTVTSESPMRQDVGPGGEADWVADLLAR